VNLDLFGFNQLPAREEILPQVILLRGFALMNEHELLSDINHLLSIAPPRTLHTPSGLPMSVTTTSCGDAGWVSDAYGYRYAKRDVKSQQPWPAIPDSFLALAKDAATAAGFNYFMPDSCLINCYKVGAKMSLHQDKNEKDFSQPIVSISLGLPAIFLLGGLARENKTIKVPLAHGDVVVWGGSSRLLFHGVLPIKAGVHSLLGEQRINLTFRKAL
jgi:alkylated DNA repair protein (DNA oxidative demethylase)